MVKRLATLFLLTILSLPIFTKPAYCIDKILLDTSIESAESLVFPNNDAEVVYNEEIKEVYIKFTTPASYRVNYVDFYSRWRDNQWVVLQEFKKAKIPVEKVTVETNYPDMSGVLKISNSAEHIDEYAKSSNDDLWLRTATCYQKSKDSNEWKKLDY